ncbi:MAG: hypothetical protein ACE149_07025 [Armatimonadota bacterium]
MTARARALIYLALSLCAGTLELGVLLMAIRYSLPLVWLPVLALSYQLGNLTPKPLLLPRWAIAGTALISPVLMITSPGLPWLLGVYALVASIAVQGGRSLSQQEGVSTTTKRIARVSGFLLAFAFGPAFACLASVLILISVCWRGHSSDHSPPSRRSAAPGILGVTMVLHQIHYFTYAPIVPWLLAAQSGRQSLSVCAGFAAGWVSYLLAPSVFGRRVAASVFSFGHLLAAAALAGLAFSHVLPFTIGLWFATGFGGGTVYVLRGMEKAHPLNCDLDIWEAVGHVAGTALAVLLLVLSMHSATPFAAASVVAALIGILAPYALRHAVPQLR